MNKKVKEEIKKLNDKIDVLEFKIKNPLGFEICYFPFNQVFIKYVNYYNEIKEFRLSSSSSYDFYKIVKDKKGNAFIEETKTEMTGTIKRLFKLDFEREILIQIKEEIINE